jgi:hypothetical protein
LIDLERAVLMSEKGLYIGAGAGIILFAIIGLLPGSIIGGAIGVKIATKIFGSPLGASLLPKLIVGVTMISGIVATGLVFIAGTSSAGWLIGCIIETSHCGKTLDNGTVVKSKK